MTAKPDLAALVGPLEWTLATTVYEPGEAYQAVTEAGIYVVAQDEDSPSLFNVEFAVGPDTFHKGQPLLINVCHGVQSAKSAAQSDYASRIAAALNPAAVEALVWEACKAIDSVPAAPVTLAQALEVPEVRALVEAVERLLAWDQRRGYPIPYRTRDPLLRALAALEQKGGA